MSSGAGSRGPSYDPAMHRILAACAVAVAVALPTSAGAAGCPGRQLLTCSEKSQTFADDANWTHAFVLELELFETRLPVHLSNPALASFWRYETSASAARSAYELELQYELSDPDFETVATVAPAPRPALAPRGIVDRRTAAALSALMRAEQAEIVDLHALVTSMNRATEATYIRGRSDWVAWQLSAAAGFSARTAGAIGRVIRAQRVATAALRHRGLPFGVGSEDLKLAQRQIRRHGLAARIDSALQAQGLTAPEIAFCVREFAGTSFGQMSFSLSQIISEPSTIAGERGFAAALKRFSARVPRASKPPS
jgi:hypothetical protein